MHSRQGRQVRIGLAVLLALAAVVFIGWYLLERSPDLEFASRSQHFAATDSSATPQLAGRGGIPDAPRDMTSGTPPIAKSLSSNGSQGTVAAPPLPPTDRPLADVFDELAERARQGDRHAACRLAWDLETCADLPRLVEIESTLVEWAAQERPASPAESRAAHRISAFSSRLARAQKVCAGLDASRTAQAMSMMRRAAELGDARSMARYALYPRFDPSRPLEQVDAMVAYRTDAPAFLERAVAAGDPIALFGLYHALARGEIMTRHGALPIDADPVRALELGLVLRTFADAETVAGIDQRIAEILPRLSAAQRDQAERAAAARVAGAFRDAAPRDFASGVLEPEIARVCTP